MSELPTRAELRAKETSAGPTIARHGRLKEHRPFLFIIKILVAIIGVVAVSSVSVAAYALWDVTSSIKPSVKLVDAKGQPIPQVGAIDGAQAATPAAATPATVSAARTSTT
jgi:hypothetical protein